MKNFKDFVAANQRTTQVAMSLEAYLEACRDNPLMWATPAQLLRKAIGKGCPIDKKDPRNARLFKDETILEYSVFSDFFGIPRTIEQVVNFIDGAAKGLQQRKQALVIVGPPSTGKTSFTKRLMQLMETHPTYVLKAGNELSPSLESPLCLFTDDAVRKEVSAHYNIPLERLSIPMSPWAHAHVGLFEGDISKFEVMRIMPSLVGSQGIAKVEPYKNHDPGKRSPLLAGLGATGQGMLELVEMFRFEQHVLDSLLSPTEDREYTIPGELGVWPYHGIIVGHSNYEQWAPFKENKNNVAFISRTREIPFPYPTRVSAERKIYQAHLAKGGIKAEDCAPETLSMLAYLGVLSRISEGVKSVPFARVLDGEDPTVVGSTRELTTLSSAKDGQIGLHPRFLCGVLANVFTANHVELRADPVSLLKLAEAAIKRDYSSVPAYENLIKSELLPYYVVYFGLQLQQACVEDYTNYGQTQLTRYVMLVNALDEGQGYVSTETGTQFDQSWVSDQLAMVEKKMSCQQKDIPEFRQSILRFWLNYKTNNPDTDLPWLNEPVYRGLVEKLTTMDFGDIWQIVVSHRNRDAKEQKEHTAFFARIVGMGYTEYEVRNLVAWWIQKKVDAGEKIPQMPG